MCFSMRQGPANGWLGPFSADGAYIFAYIHALLIPPSRRALLVFLLLLLSYSSPSSPSFLTFRCSVVGRGDGGRGGALRGLAIQWGWPKVAPVRPPAPDVLCRWTCEETNSSIWMNNQWLLINSTMVSIFTGASLWGFFSILLYSIKMGQHRNPDTLLTHSPPDPICQRKDEGWLGEGVVPVMSIPPSYKATSQTVKRHVTFTPTET